MRITGREQEWIWRPSDFLADMTPAKGEKKRIGWEEDQISVQSTESLAKLMESSQEKTATRRAHSRQARPRWNTTLCSVSGWEPPGKHGFGGSTLWL